MVSKHTCKISPPIASAHLTVLALNARVMVSPNDQDEP
jgi:hypothetical protein